MRSGKKIGLLGIILVLLMAAGGCRVRAPLPPHPLVVAPGGRHYTPAQARARYHYRYFPEAQVYFDINRSLYFYLRDDLWLSAPMLPGHIHIDLNNPVTVELDGPKPFVYHRETIRRYPPGLRKEKHREQRERLDDKREEQKDRREGKKDRQEEQRRPEKDRKGKKKTNNKRGEDRENRPAIWK